MSFHVSADQTDPVIEVFKESLIGSSLRIRHGTGDPVERRIILFCQVLGFLYLRHDIPVGIFPKRAVPSVLHVVGCVRTAFVKRVEVVHITGKHIGTQVLHDLERPVFTTTPVVIEVNALLNNSQRNPVFIELLLLRLVRETGLVRIIRFKIIRTS